MNWYYKDGETEIGPVEKGDLQQLIKTKKINAQTMIRNACGQEWKPLSEMVKPKTPQPMPETPVAVKAPGLEKAPVAESEPEPRLEMERSGAPQPVSPVQPTAVCFQCGRSLPRDQVLEFQGQALCGACKPLFVQRMREGVGTAGSLNYAGFWIRFVAKFIDGIILAIIQWIIVLPLGIISSPTTTASGFTMMMALQQLIGIVFPACYTTFFIGKFRATPGKIACRLQVVMPDGGHVSYVRALGRNFAEYISALILLIGYIMAGFDSEKRALHDRICSTRVVKR